MVTDRPNVLLLHCHDLGRFLGCYGIATVHTPSLGRLAETGVRMDNAFCAAPQCSPSRAAMFTGRWPHSTGVMGLTHANFGWDLRPEERHLASLLSEAGYRTELIGVHHESRAQGSAEISERLGFASADPEVGPATGVADRAIAAIARHAQERAAGAAPFYLQVGFHEPHRRAGANPDEDHLGFLGTYLEPDESNGITVPGYLKDDPGTRTEIAELQGAVRYLDEAIGRVLDGLSEAGLDDDTIVIFTTDHGLALPRAKGSLYDPGLEIALILRAPALGWVGGRGVDALVSNVDIVPTLFDALQLPVSAAVQGKSFIDSLTVPDLQTGDGAGRDHLFAEITYHDYYDPRRCVRTRTHKLIANFTSAPVFMDTSQSWRPRSTPIPAAAGTNGDRPSLELYDLGSDPLELINIADDPRQREVLKELSGLLADWMRDTDDPLRNGAVTSPLHVQTVDLLNQRFRR